MNSWEAVTSALHKETLRGNPELVIDEFVIMRPEIDNLTSALNMAIFEIITVPVPTYVFIFARCTIQ